MASERSSLAQPEHRSVIVEIYYRGRSAAEGAALLGIPEATVKSRTVKRVAWSSTAGGR